MKERCDECGGKGYIYDGTSSHDDCSYCDGSGFIEPSEDELAAAKADYLFQKYRDDKLTGDI